MDEQSQSTPSRELWEADRRLVRAALSGKARAVERLAARLGCIPRILAALNERRGRRLTEHDIADLTQDLALLVWRRLDSFEGLARFETWVYRYCHLTFMNYVRKVARRRPTGSAEMIDDVPAPEASDVTLDFESVELALEEIGPPESDTVRLKHFEGLTFDEIGAVQGIPPNTAKTYYYRALEQLRAKLGRLGFGGEASAAGRRERKGGLHR